MSEWKEFRVSDFADILDSKRIPLSTLQRSKRRGVYPYYGASGIIDRIDSYIFEGEHLLVSEDGENLNTRNTPIAFRASGKFWVNNHAHILRGKKDFHNRLLEIVFKDIDLSQYITGAVQPKLSQEALKNIIFKLPTSESSQRGIVDILSSLDDKLDLLNRNNRTLQQMADTLFRQWFVEEAEGSWTTDIIGHHLTAIGGTTPDTSEPNYWNGSVAWTSPKDLSGSKAVFMNSTQRTITEVGLSKIGSGLLPIGTVLLSSRAPIGYLCISNIPVAINQGYIACVCDKGISNWYIYCWIKDNMDLIVSSANGSTFLEISKGTFRSLEFVMPPDLKLKDFNEAVGPWFEKILSNEKQILSLKQLLDKLLPKLICGEMRVKT